LALAVVRDLREQRSPTTAEELADFETDLLAGFVLARAAAGLADTTIRNDTNHLELIRDWFDRPLWEMQPTDADAYFGTVLRDAKPATRTGRAGALAVAVARLTRTGAPLFPSERKNTDGTSSRATADVFRRSLADAAGAHFPTWAGKLTPHVLRHYCASQLYLGGMSLFAIQELLGHAWTGTTARYIHVHRSHVEDAWTSGQQRATERWKGLTR